MIPSMTFFAILFALLIEQVRPLAPHNPIHAGLRVWGQWVSRNFDAGAAHHGWVVWSLTVLGPSVLALAVYWALLLLFGWPFAVLWNVVVLYLTLGFRQFSHHFTAIRDALDGGDEARARELLAQWQRVDAGQLPCSEIVRHVIEYSVLAAHRHVFGVLAWFSILAALGLGPAGAVLFRMSEFVARYWKHHSTSDAQPASAALEHLLQFVAEDIAEHFDSFSAEQREAEWFNTLLDIETAQAMRKQLDKGRSAVDVLRTGPKQLMRAELSL